MATLSSSQNVCGRTSSDRHANKYNSTAATTTTTNEKKTDTFKSKTASTLSI